MKRSVLYVVAEGAQTLEAERVFCGIVRGHVGDIGNLVQQVEEVRVDPTDKGVVMVVFNDSRSAVAIAASRATALYLQGLGLRLVDRPPDSRMDFQGAGEDGDSLPEPEVVGPAEVLLVEQILVSIAKRRATDPASIAEDVKRPVDVVDRVLRNLMRSGLVAGNVTSLFALTDAGEVEAAKGTSGGRKAVVEALLADGTHSVHTLAAVMRCSDTVPKRAIKLLVDEGMVELSHRQRDGRTTPSQHYRLTEVGKQVGHDYAPPGRSRSEWASLTPKRLQMIAILMTASKPLSAPQVANLMPVPVSVTSVGTFLRESVAQGHMAREQVTSTPPTFGYSLTQQGREVGVAMLEEAASQGTVEDQPDAQTPQPAEPVRNYVVTVTGESPEAAELLGKLAALGCVVVADA